jgi:hypothetical protein
LTFSFQPFISTKYATKENAKSYSTTPNGENLGVFLITTYPIY